MPRSALVLLGLLPICTAAAQPARADDMTLVTPAFQHLEALPVTAAHYDLWLVSVQGTDTTWTSCGAFMEDPNAAGIDDLDGQPISSFLVPGNLSLAKDVVVTLELAGDADPGPSPYRILAAPLVGDAAALSIADPMALGVTFGPGEASGSLVLDTPSDDCADTGDWNSGVWFYTPGVPHAASLTLPALPSAWQYDWTVEDVSLVDAVPVRGGNFTRADGADSDGAGTYQGVGQCGAAPAFPGQDLVAPDQFKPELPVLPAFNSGTWTVVLGVAPSGPTWTFPHIVKPLQLASIPGGTGHLVPVALDVTPVTLLPSGTVTVALQTTAVRPATWGEIKGLYR